MNLTHDAQLVEISSLKPFRGNPRTHNLDLIRESLRSNGQYRPVVVRAKTREVLAGNGTMEAALAEGWEKLWATFIDCDAKAAKRIVLVDNRSNDLAGYDDTELANLLESLPRLDGTGFTDRDLEQLLKQVSDDGDFDTGPQLTDVEYRIVIFCEGEEHQAQLLERLAGEGLQVQALAQ